MGARRPQAFQLSLRQMSTQPSYMSECHPVEQQARQDLLDDLYRRSGRADLPLGHRLRSTYTGLWQEYTKSQPNQ